MLPTPASLETAITLATARRIDADADALEGAAPVLVAMCPSFAALMAVARKASADLREVR